MNSSKLVESVMLGSILAILIGHSIAVELLKRWENRPYRSDVKRAQAIRELAQEQKARLFLAHAKRLVDEKVRAQS